VNKYVRLRERTHIHTCRSYVHTPRDFTNGASLEWRLRRRISTVMFTSQWAWPARWAICPIWGFSKVHKKWEIPCFGRRWTAVQNLIPIGLSSAEKSVTVQTNKHTRKQTVNDISIPYLSACVNNKILRNRKRLHWLQPFHKYSKGRSAYKHTYNIGLVVRLSEKVSKYRIASPTYTDKSYRVTAVIQQVRLQEDWGVEEEHSIYNCQLA